MRLRESFCRAGASPAGQPDAVALQLPNEFLKEHREVQELQATAAQQQKSFQSKLEAQEKEIAVLTSGLRKIDAQFELRKPVQNWYSRTTERGFVVTRELFTGEQPC